VRCIVNTPACSSERGGGWYVSDDGGRGKKEDGVLRAEKIISKIGIDGGKERQNERAERAEDWARGGGKELNSV
jgi:hypothetical protein